MRYDLIFAYLRLSRDDEEKAEESNSIKNQKLLIEHFLMTVTVVQISTARSLSG